MTKIKFKKYKLSKKADIKNRINFTKLRVSFFLDDFAKNKNFSNLLKVAIAVIPVLFVSIISYDFYNNNNKKNLNIFNTNDVVLENKISLASGNNNKEVSEKVFEEDVEKKEIIKKEKEQKNFSKKENIEKKNTKELASKKIELKNNKEAGKLKKDSVKVAIIKNDKNDKKDNWKNSEKNIKKTDKVDKIKTQKAEKKLLAVNTKNNTSDVEKNNKEKTNRKIIQNKNIYHSTPMAPSYDLIKTEVVSQENYQIKISKKEVKNNKEISNLESISERRVLGSYYNAIDEEFEKTKKMALK